METLEHWLDGYSDIYSDFDSRQYAKRRVSEDFIHELELSFLHKAGPIKEIVLQLPGKERDAAVEPVIAESLSNYFRKQERVYSESFRKKRRGAWLLVLSGVMIMTIGAFISLRITNVVLSQIMQILLEPAGWFMLWSGMDTFVYGLNKLKREAVFFRELAVVQWHFTSIDNASAQG
jgi:hypothetical protein